jgi:hypothetical protein
MLWSIRCEPVAQHESAVSLEDAGRFVIHRHRDAEGPHLDLRLEYDGYLAGWRVDATDLTGEPWAAEKAPHPLRWLDQDGDATREDEGRYRRLDWNDDERVVFLRGRNGDRILRARRVEGLPPRVVRAVRDALLDVDQPLECAAKLIRDGLTARARAVGRFCGLARELDGDAFDEALWRKTLERLSLDEIHVHLRQYEVRFDRQYPPAPVSQPERLREDERAAPTAEVMAILRGE